MKIKYILFITCMFSIVSCNESCVNLEDQFNNGNTNPEILRVQLRGSDIGGLISSAYSCNHPSNFFGAVTANIYTASIDNNGNIIADPNPYWTDSASSAVFGSALPTFFEIEVPETGAYSISFDIVINGCNECCHGAFIGQCSSDRRFDDPIWLCEAGQARVIIEAAFAEQDRPHYDRDWIPYQLYQVMDCINCNCEVECP